MKDKPGYYAILTADVRYDKELTDSEKLLFAEITALANSTGKCWASNAYFAELYGVSTKSISRRIKSLVDRGYLDSRLTYKKGSNEVDKRVLSLTVPTDNSVRGGGDKSVHTPGDKSVQDNSTSNNNTRIKDSKKISIPGIDLLKQHFPDNADIEELWEEWMKVRKKKKASDSDRAIRSAIKKLLEFSGKDTRLVKAILERSCDSGWSDLYEFKGELPKETSSIGGSDRYEVCWDGQPKKIVDEARYLQFKKNYDIPGYNFKARKL